MRPEIVEPTQYLRIEPSAPPAAISKYFCTVILLASIYAAQTPAFDFQPRKRDAAIAPSAFLSASQGIRPRHDTATGFPVRSHHLSGRMERTAVKGELLHHCVYYNSTRTPVSMHKAPRRNCSPAPSLSGPVRPAR